MKIPLKKRFVMSVFGKYAKTQAKLHPLSYLFWECTLRCNLNCIHCGSDCKKTSSIPDMPKEDFLNVCKELKTIYNPNKLMLVLTGGEPLMREDLEECGNAFKKMGYPWGFVTNGMALTSDRYDSLIKSGLRSVTLSLDGLEDNHNWMRGIDTSFQKAVNALGIIGSRQQIVHDVVTCVNKKNINELEDIRQLLIKHKIQGWRLFTIAPIGRAKDNEYLKLNAEEVKQLFEFIKKARQDNSIKTSFSCEAFTGPYETEIKDSFFFCRAGVNIASILIDGSVSACPNISKDFIQGNIYSDSILDIWDNRFQNMRNRKWMKTGICKSCKHFKYCNGGAMHLRRSEHGEIEYCLWHEMENGLK